MSAADKIQTARALIEPLTDTTPGPWVFSERNTPEHFWIEPEVGYLPMPHYLSVSGPISRENAALIAAAPALRDTVAALADLADAQAQEIEAQALEISRAKSRGDNHWETLKGIRHIAKTSGDLERIILWVNDAGSGYMATPEASLAEVCDERNAARAEADAQAQENARLRGCFEQIEEAALNGCLTPDLVARITRAALGDAP